MLDFDDEAASQNEYYAEFPTLPYAWIYIAIDIRDMRMSKIGLTRQRDPQKRLAQGKTYNPFLTLFAVYNLAETTYGISNKELRDIENYIQSRAVFGDALKHFHTGRHSEWFFLDPDEAEAQVDWMIAKRGFAVDGKYLYTHDEKDEKFNGISVERLKKIKTIFRPFPDDFSQVAAEAGMPTYLCKDYLSYLDEFHSRDADGQIYL
ncbi:GIY-YIG nuclease family protein [Vibrio parahaemolyticus]|nr:GIY-YIG nuclease family protein [Vibrio parahaemolyticus]EGQ8195907.1 GIY-YIG nuclease family protein [Vibrio parahaemolyticus]EKA7361486.1 GIY-YIG nuclease family protein [Vibrio parahaemolyticus]TOB18885.1 hypothetical protein CGK11_23485 [Vibrio parahaemolyticus]TOL07503.1 hypothetical protein CGI05_24115 [Vibrio parahaemolyticus]TOO91793.1 hypothetical protein CGH25_23840 [Vibrio parahaemolyticus]